MSHLLAMLHVQRAPDLVSDPVLMRAVLCRHARSCGRRFVYLVVEST